MLALATGGIQMSDLFKVIAIVLLISLGLPLAWRALDEVYYAWHMGDE